MKIAIPQLPLEQLRQIAPAASLATEADREILRQQLGRIPRGLVGIAARCCCGNPAVTITYPRLEDGSPFPTTFYLSLSSLVKEISRIESTGGMEAMNEELSANEELATQYRHAHEIYVQRRELMEEVPEIAGKSAGGMPDRIKCLHALAGYALAVGAGICPFGDRALQQAGWDTKICRCGAAARN